MRVSEVCSSVTETDALGITPPEASVTSPVIPPSVCCAARELLHNAMAAAIISSPGKENGDTRLKCFKRLTSK